MKKLCPPSPKKGEGEPEVLAPLSLFGKGAGGEGNFAQRAVEIYRLYQDQYPRRFKWIHANLFRPELQQHLQQDARLLALLDLLQQKYPTEKVLIFTQFADTANYLARALEDQNIQQVGLATG